MSNFEIVSMPSTSTKVVSSTVDCTTIKVDLEPLYFDEWWYYELDDNFKNFCNGWQKEGYRELPKYALHKQYRGCPNRNKC